MPYELQEKVSESPVESRLAHVRVKKFAEQELETPSDEIAGASYSISFGAELDAESSSVTVGVLVGIDAGRDSSSLEHILDAEVVCRFKIRDIEALRQKDGRVVLPRVVLATLLGISISTIRGVIIGKTSFPDLAERFPLPILSPLEIVKEFADDPEVDWVSKS